MNCSVLISLTAYQNQTNFHTIHWQLSESGQRKNILTECLFQHLQLLDS